MPTSSTQPATVTQQARHILRKFGAQLSGRDRGQDPKVRRDSLDVDDRRAQVSRRLADGSEAGTLAYIDALLRTAREFDLFTRQRKGFRPLGDTALHILDVVLRGHWHHFQTGRIDPAISQIMKATGYVRQTVVDGLAKLAKHGFLDWIRRTERVAHPIPGGPTRQQANNSYFVDLAIMAARAGKNVRDRFLQHWHKAKARLALAASKPAATAKLPITPSPAPRPKPETDLASALASLGAAVERTAPSLENRQSPAVASKG